MIRNQLCFWLIPVEPLKQQLSNIIQQLATEWNANPFDPHVTIYNSQLNKGEACSIAQRAAQNSTFFELEALGLDHSDEFSKTLFVQFVEHPGLRQLSETIKADCTRQQRYELNPHLSLLYKKMAADDQSHLCRTLSIPNGKYRFGVLRVVNMKLPFTDPKQTSDWQTVFEVGLKA